MIEAAVQEVARQAARVTLVAVAAALVVGIGVGAAFVFLIR
jgi:hypothetical protein